MADTPWLTIVGLGEDGLEGLPLASRVALESAEIIMGPPRHLSLLPGLTARRIEWPVPFSAGLDVLAGLAGQKVVVLASGDPFWFGAGSVIAQRFPRSAWKAMPVPSVFSLAASCLGWRLEETVCLGLHAAPVARIRPFLAKNARIIVTVRGGTAVADVTSFLKDSGFGDSAVTVLQALGGPRERVAAYDAENDISHPVALAIEVAGSGPTVPCATGLPDALFQTDGVMTKRVVRAVTLSTLAPGPGERLWDIGGGSGSIGIEWLLAHPRNVACSIEPRADRVALIRANAAALGVDRLTIVTGSAPACLHDLPQPDAVFIGGGVSEDMLTSLDTLLPEGTRVVANAVTLEAEALLADWQTRKGGELLRLDVSRMTPMGSKRGWSAAYPVVQWSVTW